MFVSLVLFCLCLSKRTIFIFLYKIKVDNCHYEKYAEGTKKNIQDEIPFELPDGWCWVRFGTLTINRDNERKPVSSASRKNVVKKYDYYGASGKIDKIDNYLFDEKLLLIGEDGANLLTRSKPIAFFAEGQYWVNNHAHCIDSTDKRYLDYVCYYINAINLEKYVTGSAQPKMNQENMNSILISLPPFNEQLRILNEIDVVYTLTEKIDINQTDLIEVKALIKSKILELAIQGKLVEQDENDEAASVLLERIRAEKKAKLGKKYVESYIYKGDDNCYYEKVGSVIKNITEFIPFEIPASWRFIRLKELIKLISGVSYDKCDICADGIRILRGGNIGNLTIQIQQDDVFLPAKYFDEEKQVRIGDVIIVASTGSKVAIGRAGFIEKEYLGTQIGAFLRIVRPIDIAFANYIKCIFSTDYYREHIRDMVHGNTINNIKSDYIEDFIVPLPSIKEQKRICLQVENVMSILKDED